jgi:hypothetical protein
LDNATARCPHAHTADDGVIRGGRKAKIKTAQRRYAPIVIGMPGLAIAMDRNADRLDRNTHEEQGNELVPALE